MNSFKGFVVKEFYHIFRDTRTMLILFGMPLVQMLLFGFAIRNEVNDAKIVIIDHAHDVMTHQITDKLLSSGYFIPAVSVADESEITDAFQQGLIKMAIVFEPQFAERFVRDNTAKLQIITDATEPNIATTLTSYATAIIQDYQNSVSAAIPAGRIVPELRMLYNPQMKSVYLFVPGLIALLLMLISALMTSITITREKELGTMEILLVSPLKPFQIILGKVIPYLFLSLVNVTTILLLSRFIFEVPFRGSYGFFYGEAFIFILTALALGILISTIVQSQQAAMMISLVGLILPTLLLSGFIFPVTSMPWPLQLLSNIIPAKWFLIIIKGIMLKGLTIDDLWRETAILSGIMMFLLVVSINKFKVRLQ